MRRFSKFQPIRNKNYPCRPCFLSNQDEISNSYRGSDIDASYQDSDHLAKQFIRIAYGCHVC